MNGHEHFDKAEHLVSLALQRGADGEPRLTYQIRQTYLAAAQVHAALAQAHAEGALVNRIAALVGLLACELAPDQAAGRQPAGDHTPSHDRQPASPTFTPAPGYAPELAL